MHVSGFKNCHISDKIVKNTLGLHRLYTDDDEIDNGLITQQCNSNAFIKADNTFLSQNENKGKKSGVEQRTPRPHPFNL